ncbi:MAG TPA: DUF4112 domain-containing protein [Hyphomicrobiaceae bacterium]|nr:DUF4112 domain-containing protein [Hyphomicrobiaceae bacterium]
MARGDVEILAPGDMPSESAQETFERLDKLSKLLDTAILIPGTNIRFGVDALIGLVPVVGDMISTAMSSWLIYEAHRLGISRLALWRMMGNVAIDGVVGAIPFLGDAFDVAFRANRRNLRILRDQLARRR